ncbi:MAG: MBL fold metallo-hydrolase [Candidatus Hadarchaeum sp.]|uniref:MBL fold metallo-hydrolase n=1 Tax=Candidatus Hadarchaeum sp. TaxID=2883567 RepID=UPI003180548D
MNSVDGLRLTVLVEDTKKRPDLAAKHGLSFFIEVESAGSITTLLLDAGPSAELVLGNARKLGIDLGKLDYIVISHGHYDHTGGLLGVLKFVNKKVPVVLHPQALVPKFVVKQGRLKKIGITSTVAELEGAGGFLARNRKTHSLMPGVWVSGEIKRTNQYELVKGFKTEIGGKVVKDNLPDDQALFVKLKNEGLLVITGCAHAGIINTIEHAQKATGLSRLRAVIGGFHLFGSSARRINWTTEELQKQGVELLMPCHCTGRRAIAKFVKLYGKNCHRLRTGDAVVF